MRVHQRDTLGWLVVLSVALHLTLGLCLLIFPSTRPPIHAAEPISMDFVAEDRLTEAAPEPSAPEEATAAPMEQAASVQQPEIPPPAPVPAPDAPPPAQTAETPPPLQAPAPDVTPSPPVPDAELPLPTPAPAPDVPPPAQAAALQPAPTPVPVPLPMPVLPALLPPKPVAQVRPVPALPPRPTAPQRAAARPAATRAPVDPAGEPARATAGQAAQSRAILAASGAAWMGKLKQWWDLHSFYPPGASQTNEGGNVRVRMSIAADGQVTSIDVVQGSGSSVLDAAAIAVFRNAHLSPFPPGTPAQPADLVLTLHYRPADGG